VHPKVKGQDVPTVRLNCLYWHKFCQMPFMMVAMVLSHACLQSIKELKPVN